MLGAIRNLLLYRVLGGRVMLALTLMGLVRRLLDQRGGSGESGSSTAGRTTRYQPSQGSSQIVQRDPR